MSIRIVKESDTERGRRLITEYLTDGWKTLDELRRDLRAYHNIAMTEQTVSARVRDLRKPKYGGHRVERQPRPGKRHLYRIVDDVE